MLVNLWSTPRTGSTWYSLFLYKQYLEKYPRTYLIKQFLNQYHLINYTYLHHTDFIYEYKEGATYLDYEFDFLGKKLLKTNINGKRKRDKDSEERYRLDLLSKIDQQKNTFIFHNHIEPMSKQAYETLLNTGDVNIFLYRENIVDQLSSYAVGYFTNNYHNSTEVNNVIVSVDVLKYLADRIISWHKLDKSKGLIIKYEDLPFSKTTFSSLPKKQNNIKAFDKLSNETKETVLSLNDYIIKSI